MKKTRKVLLTVLSVLTIAAVSLGAASCEVIGHNPPPNSSTSQTTDNEFRQVYAMYVTYAEEQGITPLSYEAWLMSIRGEKGDKGEKGEQGPAGEDGKDGVDGEDGQDGLTPYVGENGNWWIGDIDTGIQATGDKGDQGEQGPAGADGEDGKDGADGADGKSAYQIWLEAGHEGSEADFLAWLKGATGEKGDKGDQGDQGVGIEKVEYDADGNLVITFTDGTTQTVVMPEPETHVHTFGEWTAFTTDDTPCENRLFFRVCSDCKSIEWKQGSYADHAWSTEYTCDDSYHWNICDTCGKVSEKEEHTYDESDTCSICGKPAPATEGVLYQISSDNTYAEVIGYEGTATRVRIADTYNDLPVKTIYERAFYNNDKITAVIIPDSVTSIGDYAFWFCDSLTSVVIGDSVTSIGDDAFEYCYSLTSVEIPNGVTSIGEWAFAFCSSLTFNEYGNCQYLGNEENPYHALIRVKTQNYSSYTIHEDTKVIADSAFYKCARMGSIVIPDSVTSIGEYAFANCSSLTSVEIPDSVTLIGSSAFSGCSSLTSVVLPDSVTSIGDWAFSYCSSLTSVVIGDSVTSIGDGAFAWCSSLTSVYYKGTASEWSSISINSTENSYLTDATRYYYSETNPTSSGRYWHYVYGKVTVW